jgi:hypothetical protein
VHDRQHQAVDRQQAIDYRSIPSKSNSERHNRTIPSEQPNHPAIDRQSCLANNNSDSLKPSVPTASTLNRSIGSNQLQYESSSRNRQQQQQHDSHQPSPPRAAQSAAIERSPLNSTTKRQFTNYPSEQPPIGELFHELTNRECHTVEVPTS